MPINLSLSICNKGLGDCVAFSSVLAHLQHYEPKTVHAVAVPPGIAGIFKNAYTLGTGEVPYVNTLWRHTMPVAEATADPFPATPAVWTIRNRLNLTPLPELLRYRVEIPRWAEYGADAFVNEKLKGLPFATLHYIGRSYADKKNLRHEDARVICLRLLSLGLVPLVWDWDGNCPFVSSGVVLPNFGKCAATIAAVLARSALNICVDSGVGKLALAVDAPCLSIWTGHHPLHCVCPAPNNLNLIPAFHSGLIRGDVRSGLDYFYGAYSYKVYQELLPTLLEQIQAEVSKV